MSELFAHVPLGRYLCVVISAASSSRTIRPLDSIFQLLQLYSTSLFIMAFVSSTGVGVAGLRRPAGRTLPPSLRRPGRCATATGRVRMVSAPPAPFPSSPVVDPPVPGTVALVALGCAKNTVDAEVLLADIDATPGLTVIDDPATADCVIVNTCAFVEDAKRASVEAILAAAALQADSPRRSALVVTGCMAQRYAGELAAALPEVDAVVGFENYAGLPAKIGALLTVARSDREDAASTAADVAVGAPTVPFRPEWRRKRLTPRHSAYLRVAEGCNNNCSFCVIPSFRGAFRSKPFDALMEEVRVLVEAGVVEFNIIGEGTWGNRLAVVRLVLSAAEHGAWREEREMAARGCFTN